MPTCRTCKYLDVKPDRRGRVLPRKHNVYPCTAPDPAKPVLPACMDFSHPWGMKWPPHRAYMQPDDGEECPIYEARPKPAP